MTKVLIVEDSSELLHLYVRALERRGVMVQAAGSMEEALAAYCRLQPDVLLCDISMPHGSGIDLIRAIRALEKDTSRHLPAAAVTGIADPARCKDALAAGFDEYVVKPVMPSELIGLVQRLTDGTPGWKGGRAASDTAHGPHDC